MDFLFIPVRNDNGISGFYCKISMKILIIPSGTIEKDQAERNKAVPRNSAVEDAKGRRITACLMSVCCIGNADHPTNHTVQLC